jgi:hypothetical protein
MALNILNKFCAPPPDLDSTDGLNITVAAKVAFAGFLRSGEFMCDDRDDRHTFINTNLTRSCYKHAVWSATIGWNSNA